MSELRQSVAIGLTAAQATRRGRRNEDTAAGCRANAEADLTRAADLAEGHVRQRMEHSAAVWADRAEMLERLDRKFAARIAAPRSGA
jgi:hypothetical protein